MENQKERGRLRTHPRISIAIISLIVIIGFGGWQSVGFATDSVAFDWSSLAGFAVVALVALVFAFFMVKLRIASGANLLRLSLLSLLLGDEYGPDAPPLIGSVAFGSFALGRTFHAMWSRSPLQLVEFAAFAAAVGLYCGAKLALADERAKGTKS